MSAASRFDPSLLNQQGLNLQCVFNISQLPADMRTHLETLLPNLKQFSQLILLGHGGRKMWDSLPHDAWKQGNHMGHNIVDDNTVAHIKAWCQQQLPGKSYDIAYPSNTPIGLQALGTLAGWHFPSPFMVGINNLWGSWFAYRAVVLCDSDFAVTEKLKTHSPCDSCHSKICIELCPAQACSVDKFDMHACLSYRQSEHSKCKSTCLARVGCPVAKPHKYKKQQMQYHYGVSMKMIEALNLPADI
jgi:epoxyqueuosine reductase